MFVRDGYTIFCNDGVTVMEFVDKTKTSGIADVKTATAICNSHGYEFEVI